MKDVKIAFFDLDGTLLNDNGEISNQDIATLRNLKNMGIKIALASGRYDKYVLKYAEIIDYPDYIISNNGSLVYDKDNNILFEDAYDDKLLTTFWNYAMDSKVGITLNSQGQRYSNSYSTTKSNDNIIINDLDEVKGNVYQIVFSSMEHDKIKDLLDYLSNMPIHITYVSSHYYTKKINKSISVDINLKTVSKGVIIKKIIDSLNIKKEETMCFGDNINDIDMFNECGIKVAMENGDKEIKKIASYITLDNNHSGITHFIDKFINENK